ncbi:MAG: tetratricopeptide repeat protein [Candidatus Aminicenantes bacterium]|nr:MAG: tetratricopeptide repeat protein [Candidatus Aminicenantes bacterium]
MTTQQIIQYNEVSKEADELYDRGCYVCLKQAFELYKQAVSIPVFQKKTTEKLLKTAILLGLRERELGVLQETYFPKAEAILAASPYLADYSVLLKIASTIPRKTVGIVGDFVEDGDRVIVSMDDLRNDLEEWTKLIREKSKIEEIYAYVAIGFFPTFSYFIKEELDVELIEQAFPDSPLIRYKLALLPKGNPLVLENLAQDDPQFSEAFFFLGQSALKKGMLVTAEKNFLKAYQEIPQSSSLVISLASIYFAFEELDKSLEFYEKTLALAPVHRDALLGKAMCLSYLGKHDEAIDACNTIVDLGKYYLGESHYWLAWNLNELEQWEEAWNKIETSKKYLIGHGEVFFLSGLIAFNRQRLDEAEKNLLEAHKQDDSNGDPAYYLGKIKNIQEDWLNAGAYFESASRRYGIKENMIQEKIDAIKDSAFSEERKKKHLAKKTSQLKMMQLTKATSWYNAAAGFYNAGFPKKASQLAEKAVSHPGIKEKAEDLLKLIKK